MVAIYWYLEREKGLQMSGTNEGKNGIDKNNFLELFISWMDY